MNFSHYGWSLPRWFSFLLYFQPKFHLKVNEICFIIKNDDIKKVLAFHPLKQVLKKPEGGLAIRYTFYYLSWWQAILVQQFQTFEKLEFTVSIGSS